MEEAGDGPLFCERAAGTGTGKQTIVVTVRIPSETREGGRQQETREFGTTKRRLLALAGWLRSWGVTRAGMESTSDCRKPAHFTLEREGLGCVPYQASQVKVLPGRPKTGKLDSVRLAKVTERGPLAGSFVPPEEIGRLRTSHPLPQAAGPGADRGEAAGGEAAAGRAPEAAGRDQRRPRRLRPRHAGRDRRRRARPPRPGGDGPRRWKRHRTARSSPPITSWCCR